jgi:hypothetical protein
LSVTFTLLMAGRELTNVGGRLSLGPPVGALICAQPVTRLMLCTAAAKNSIQLIMIAELPFFILRMQT